MGKEGTRSLSGDDLGVRELPGTRLVSEGKVVERWRVELTQL